MAQEARAKSAATASRDEKVRFIGTTSWEGNRSILAWAIRGDFGSTTKAGMGKNRKGPPKSKSEQRASL